MTIKVSTPGATATVIIYLPNPAPDGYIWHKYNPVTGWYDYSHHAIFNDTRDQVTITFTDGGTGDNDGVANGIIIDPLGLGTPKSGSKSNGGGGCFISNMNLKLRPYLFLMIFLKKLDRNN